MKSLFIFAGVMVVLFIAAPSKVESQKRNTTVKVIEGTVIGDVGGNAHWQWIDIKSAGKTYKVGLQYNNGQGTNPKVIGGECCLDGMQVRVTYRRDSDYKYGILHATRIVILHGSDNPTPATADPNRETSVNEALKAINKVLFDAGIPFNEGLVAYADNQRSAAGASFDKSVEIFLYSTLNIRKEPTLQACYNQLVETIYRIEFPSDQLPPQIRNLSKTCNWNIDNVLANKVELIAKESAVKKPGFNPQEFEPSPLDDLSKLQLTVDEQSPISNTPAAPLAYDRIRVPPSTKLSIIAQAADTSVAYLRSINPQLSSDTTPPEPYIINVPARKAIAVGAAVRRSLGIVLTVTAKAGDTVTQVAERYGANPVEVAKYNGLLPGSVLPAGRQLKIPYNVEASKKAASKIETGKSALPKFRNGITYREVRKKLILMGWQPVTLPTATPCGDDDRCQGLPEVYFCSGVGQAVCIYMWKKKTTLIRVYGSGESMDQNYYGLKPCPLHPTQFDPECGGRAPDSSPIKSKPKTSVAMDCVFCGKWKYVGLTKGWEYPEGYLKISQEGTTKFKIAHGYVGAAGQIDWDDGVHVKNRWCGISGFSGASYLKLLNEKLAGTFVTCNWLYSTEGYETTYKVTVALTPTKKIRYSVWSAMRGGKPLIFLGTRVSN